MISCKELFLQNPWVALQSGSLPQTLEALAGAATPTLSTPGFFLLDRAYDFFGGNCSRFQGLLTDSC